MQTVVPVYTHLCWKASAIPFLSDDNTPLTSDEDRLHRWREHFARVVNCGSLVSKSPLSLCHASSLLMFLLLHLLRFTAPCVLPYLRRRSVLPCVRPSQAGLRALMEYLLTSSNWEALFLSSGWRPLLTKYGRMRWSQMIGRSSWLFPFIKREATQSAIITGALIYSACLAKCRAILNWLKPLAESSIRESQCGFHHGRGCTDHLFSLCIMMEKAHEFRSPLYMCFVDLRKVYTTPSIRMHCGGC